MKARQVDWPNFLDQCEQHKIKMSHLARKLGCNPSRLSMMRTRGRGDFSHSIGSGLLSLHQSENFPFEVRYLDDNEEGSPNESVA